MMTTILLIIMMTLLFVILDHLIILFYSLMLTVCTLFFNFLQGLHMYLNAPIGNFQQLHTACPNTERFSFNGCRAGRADV